MENFIYNYFRKREERALLKEIMSLNPELVEISEAERLNVYISREFNLFLEQEKAYEQRKSAILNGEETDTQLGEAPFIPMLLLKAIQHVADEQPAFIHFIVALRKHMELINLRAETVRIEELKGFLKHQVEINDQMLNVAKTLTKTVEQTKQSTLPENRLN